MVAPVDVKVENGKVLISQAEFTSEGFMTKGLNPLERQPAGIACYLTHPTPMTQEYPGYVFNGSYVAATYIGDNDMDGSYSLNTHHAPLVNNTDGSVAGYKYFNFDKFSNQNYVLSLNMKPKGISGTITVMIDSPWESKGGKVIGTLQLSDSDITERDYDIPVKLSRDIKGKHALYFRFSSEKAAQSLCDIYSFVFK